MTVAIARVTIFVGGSRSLKDKRMVVRRVKDLVREKFNASIAEVVLSSCFSSPVARAIKVRTSSSVAVRVSIRMDATS